MEDPAAGDQDVEWRSADGVTIRGRYLGGDPDGGSPVVLVHGLTATGEESGSFTALARDLATQGRPVLRFDFRGHGRSDGTAAGMTVAGEMLDLHAALGWLEARHGRGPVSMVAASFGAVAALLVAALPRVAVDRMVLWNPVLDVESIFFSPTGEWGRGLFGRERMRELLTELGEVPLGPAFALGPVVVGELERCDLRPAFAAAPPGGLVVHGDADQHVPFEPVARLVATRADWTMHRVPGGEHGCANRSGLASQVRQLTVAHLLGRG